MRVMAARTELLPNPTPGELARRSALAGADGPPSTVKVKESAPSPGGRCREPVHSSAARAPRMCDERRTCLRGSNRTVHRPCRPVRTTASEVNNLQVPPFFTEILGDQPPVAVGGVLLAAEQARPVKNIAINAVYPPLFDQSSEPARVFLPGRPSAPVGVQQVGCWCHLEKVAVVDAGNLTREKDQIVFLGKPRKLRSIIQPHVDKGANVSPPQAGEKILRARSSESDREDLHGATSKSLPAFARDRPVAAGRGPLGGSRRIRRDRHAMPVRQFPTNDKTELSFGINSVNFKSAQRIISLPKSWSGHMVSIRTVVLIWELFLRALADGSDGNQNGTRRLEAFRSLRARTRPPPVVLSRRVRDLPKGSRSIPVKNHQFCRQLVQVRPASN